MAKMKHPRRAGWMKTMMQNRDRMRLLWVCLGFVVLLFVVKWYTTGFQELLPGLVNGFQNRCKDVPPIEAFDGNLLCAGSRGFVQASRIFNKQAQKEPLVVMQPKNPAAVAQILRLAVAHDIPVTVKGGGHSPAGWSVEEGAIMIDMSLMKRVKVDSMKKTLWAEGGARWMDVIPHVEAHNLAYVGGECRQVGVVGIALGGGTGWLSRSHGLVSDSILSLEMVFPNGTIIDVSQTQFPDLLWALSGAGHGNFGVVTSIEYQLYDAQPSYFAGHVCYPLRHPEELRRFARAYSEAMPKITDNRLTAYHVIRRSFRSDKEVSEACYTLVFNGPKEEGLHASQPLLDSIADAMDKDVACRIPPRCYLRLIDAPSEHLMFIRQNIKSGEPFIQGMTFTEIGNLYGGDPFYVYWKSGILDDVSESTMDTLVDALLDDQLQINNEANVIQIQLNHNGGAILEKTSQFSSFPYRKSKYVFALHAVIGGAPELSTVNKMDDQQMHGWATRAYKRLQPLITGAYSNYNDADLEEWGKMYYGGNLEKLMSIKNSIEGHQIFRTTQKL